MKRRRSRLSDAEFQQSLSQQWMIILADLLLLLLTLFVLRLSLGRFEKASLERRLMNVFGRAEAAAFSARQKEGFLDALRIEEVEINSSRLPLFGAIADSITAVQGAPESGSQPQGRLDFKSGAAIERRGAEVRILLPAGTFIAGSDSLTFIGAETLSTLAKTLRGRPLRITVSGHAEKGAQAAGEFATEWDLSIAQALAAAEQLRRAGLPMGNVFVGGYGASKADPADSQLELLVSPQAG